MPQMAPLWWSALFLTFLMSFMMMCIIMHFQNTQEPLKMDSKTIKVSMMNWKW
uniref:ATP synthase F0 subunit 8 n=1 Tax=Peirates lepturoides TaxID=1457305 RepID=A0A0C4K3G7_9HEMI|nr:ATP synthase F0 subunit 8 [Peirates lepturoides]AHH93173.1 ATP synthase F0 subunit 8 [Peirates lepturoides]